jgi:NAD(P)-dependent dehydrogenase (short-subunit alcohol dehydrogenase family)
MTRKVAIITGATGGIGSSLAARFRAEGYAVVATSRSMGSDDAPGLVTVAGDLTQVEFAHHVTELAIDRFGRIDTLVNNAGVYVGKPFTEYSLDEYAAMRSVNLDAFFYITQPAIDQMVSQGTGHVVNISTSLVDQADSSRPAALAALTKGGLVAAARSLAIEYASRGVRVNAVSLGVIRSATGDDAAYDALAHVHPLGRVGEVSDVVDGILYLEQAPFITGETLHIDGGQVAGH